MSESAHPNEGDEIVLTDIVHDKAIAGLPLPNGHKMADCDQRFDEIRAEVIEIETFTDPFNDRIERELVTIRTEDGDEATLTYRGREPISGQSGSSMTVKNSQGAQQSYVWEKADD